MSYPAHFDLFSFRAVSTMVYTIGNRKVILGSQNETKYVKPKYSLPLV